MKKVIYTFLLVLMVYSMIISQTSQLFYKLDFERDTTRIPTEIPSLEGLPQDQMINPNEYILGPGDEISIAIIGPLSQFYTIPISPEGKLYLPQVDVFQLDKNETLTKFKLKIIDYLKKYFRESKIEVFLSHLKTFRVSITGSVENPGLYVINGVSRLSDVLKTAGITNKSSLRMIKVSNEDTVIYYDLLYFLRTGDKKNNPYLHQGDKIFVPALEPRFNKIQILGAVNQPGVYEYRPGDTVQKILDIAEGIWTNADSEHINIARFISSKSDYKNIVISLKNQKDFPLQPDDRVMVYELSDFRKKYAVQVVGEVNSPGFYPINDGETRLTDIIKAAGGFTKEASLFNAQLLRKALEEIQDPELMRLNKMLASDMTEIEREYWKIRNREAKNLVAVDFEKLFKLNVRKFDVELRNGDVIYIPKKTKNVTVSGAVFNPGIQVFKPGENYDYYIQAAGGLNKKAHKSRIQIIKTRTGTWYNASKKIPIEEGDIIFIPEKPIRNYWVMFRDGLTVMTQITALVAIVYNVTRVR